MTFRVTADTERSVAVAGALLAAVRYSSVPAVSNAAQAVVAVVVGVVGSATFRPAAGALMAQAGSGLGVAARTALSAAADVSHTVVSAMVRTTHST